MLNKTGRSADNSSHFDTDLHVQQIKQYLPMLNDKAIEQINAAQKKTDAIFFGRQLINEYHFDNNKISSATVLIRRLYNDILIDFKESPGDIFDEFGRLTHALQDFYSHSNWYELSTYGFTKSQRLFSESYGEFETLKPLDRIGQTRIVVAQKTSKDKDPITEFGKLNGKWYVDPKTHGVWANIDNQPDVGGLMTGEVLGAAYGAGESVELVDAFNEKKTYPGFDHGGIAGTASSKYLGPLAKDNAKATYFKEVIELARDQVQHEFVRLVSLIHSRFGNDGLRTFSRLFIRAEQQDEFKALIRSRGFDVDNLAVNSYLNTPDDNQATDAVIAPFFKDGNPDVKPIGDSHEYPEEIEIYGKEIEDGHFRWVASNGLADDGASLVFQVYRNGSWLTTDFTSMDLEGFR